ncbi:hypothetical protein ACA910_020181 [Epithemia clementina (nom. ined.)]
MSLWYSTSHNASSSQSVADYYEQEIIQSFIRNLPAVSHDDHDDDDKINHYDCIIKNVQPQGTTKGKTHDFNIQDLSFVQKDLKDVTRVTMEQTAEMKSLLKESRIQFALQMVGHVQSFVYYINSSRSPDKILGSSDGSFLIGSILWSFRNDQGYSLPNGFLIVQGQHGEECDYQGFRNRLVTQLHQLLGSKPRLEEESNGTFSIWYE